MLMSSTLDQSLLRFREPSQSWKMPRSVYLLSHSVPGSRLTLAKVLMALILATSGEVRGRRRVLWCPRWSILEQETLFEELHLSQLTKAKLSSLYHHSSNASSCRCPNKLIIHSHDPFCLINSALTPATCTRVPRYQSKTQQCKCGSTPLY